MKRKDFKESIPLVILLILGIVSIIQIATTDYIFTYQQYIGLTLLAVTTFIFFIHRRSYKYLMAIMLILGTFNLVGFTTTIYTIGLFGLPIQIIPAFVLMIFCFIYRKEIANVLQRWTENTDDSDKMKDERKNSFKSRFEKLSDAEIENRLNDEGLIPEAKEALKELKEERARAITPPTRQAAK